MARVLFALALVGCLALAAGAPSPSPAPTKAAASPAPAKAALPAPTKAAASPAPAKAAAGPACEFIDLTKREQKLCVSQFVAGAKTNPVVPTTIDGVMVVSDAACVLLKFGSSDPASTIWGGAVGRCYNGNKYVTGETLVALKCCPTGAKAQSALARARDTNAESGVKVGQDLATLARYRDTQAYGGANPGSADFAGGVTAFGARYRDTQAQGGADLGSADFAGGVAASGARVREDRTTSADAGSLTSGH